MAARHPIGAIRLWARACSTIAGRLSTFPSWALGFGLYTLGYHGYLRGQNESSPDDARIQRMTRHDYIITVYIRRSNWNVIDFYGSMMRGMFICSILFSAIIIMANVTKLRDNSVQTPCCHPAVSTQSFTPLKNTEHLMVSAYMDNRTKGWEVRIIAILRKDYIVPLHCVFYCGGKLYDHSTQASLHGDMGFGFPFETKFVMCPIPITCKNPLAVTLSIHPHSREARQHSFLPIRNLRTGGTEAFAIKPQFDFTVCLSAIFGEYNNVLQFTQALEMYRLLGVGRVMVYNTSYGPDLGRLLHSYSEEGFVEVVPWPIDKHLTPSRGWKYPEHEGDLHYYGQMATLHDCLYRNMERSHYVLLHDIDEIIVPYHHNSLKALMSQLEKQEPKAGVFRFQMDFFPTYNVTTSHTPHWEGVPGINILEHIYSIKKTERDRISYKMIVQPRMVEELSVHLPKKYLGNSFDVPPDMPHVIHTRGPYSGSILEPTYKEPGQIDTRLWHFHEELIAGVDKALWRIGMLKKNHTSVN